MLDGNKYNNVSRKVSGDVAVDNSDVVLLCDTTTLACTINLASIPSNKWSTQYKLYVKDDSNNASVNNITIVAPTGFKVNNQSSVVLSSNGACAKITITSNLDYLAESTLILNPLSATDSSTIDFTVVGSNITGVVKYADTFSLQKSMSDPSINYLPKVEIYNPAGTVSPAFYSDINYASGLGVHDIKSYDATLFTGNFNTGSLDNTTGYITIPTNGIYVFQARLRAIINELTLGAPSLISANPNTAGIMWNNSVKNRAAYMQLSISLNANTGGSNQVTKIELTDVGNIKFATPTVITRCVAGQKIKLLVLNNSDLDYYGNSTSENNITITGAKIAD